MALRRGVFAVALILTVSEAVTPIEKVVNLLEDLKKSTEAEGKKEATSYEKFACFCKDTTKEKSDSIEKQQDKIDTTTADIGDKTAKKEEKITKLGKEHQKVEETTLKLEEATEAYLKDKATYEATNADLTKALGSMKRALTSLKDSKKGAAFLSLGESSDVRTALDLADALGFVEKSTHQAALSFLQRVDPDDPEYKFHSDKIIEILESLQKDFKENRDEVQAEWEKTDKSFKAEKKDMEEKIDTAKKEIKTLEGEIDKLKSEIAKLKEDLVTAESTLEDDSKYLRDLTTRCEAKGQAWDQRSKARHGEVEALTQALKVLKGDALKDTDKINKRALLIAKKPSPPKAAVAATSNVSKPAPAKDSKPKTEKPSSFLQVGEKSKAFLSKVARTQQMAKERTIKLLSHEGARLNSIMLSSLATQIAGDPFVKIKKLIQGLIERLLQESKEEATKKGFCDTELGKSYETRDSRFADINRLDAELSELEAHKKKLEDEIDELTEDVKSLNKELKKATDLRSDEKSDNAKTVKDATAGAKAVGEALTILKDYYAKAAKGKLLLQVSASPVDEDDPGSGFDGAYKGDQDSSKAILGLLQVIKSDFERTISKTEAEEDKNQADFVLFDRTSKADIAGKETKTELDKQDLESTKSAIDQGMKDLKTATKLLDAALKNVEDLKPVCLDTGMSYKERVAKREEEIKALGKALCALDPEKVEDECK